MKLNVKCTTLNVCFHNYWINKGKTGNKCILSILKQCKLVIGNCILDKSNQDPNLKKDYTKEFELD